MQLRVVKPLEPIADQTFVTWDTDPNVKSHLGFRAVCPKNSSRHSKSHHLRNAVACRKLPATRFPLTTTGGLLRLWLWFEILAGWTLTTLLVVGVSGLVRS